MNSHEKLDEAQMRSMTLADLRDAIESLNSMELARNGQQSKKLGFI